MKTYIVTSENMQSDIKVNLSRCINDKIYEKNRENNRMNKINKYNDIYL